jgi:hypothetical protein
LNDFLEGLQPSPSDPQNIGLIPLSIAAEWIGSGGGKVPFQPDDWQSWELAYGAIVAAASKGRLKIYGVLDGECQIVPEGLFRNISTYLVDFDRPLSAPFSPLETQGAIAPKYFIRAIIYPGEEEWLYGHNDALLRRIPHRKDPGQPDDEWVQLQVRRRVVRKLWNLDKAELRTRIVGRDARRKPEALEIYRSLGPAVASGSITKASERVASILDARYPEEPPFKPRTIERYIREEIRSREK